MAFTPNGKHLVAGQWLDGNGTFTSSPAHGPAHDFAVGTVELVNRAAEAAEDAFLSYGYASRAERAAFLRAIADEIEARAEAITEIGTQETGLPVARLQGERGRTTGQLRLFASVVREGRFLDVRIDKALPTPAYLQLKDHLGRAIDAGLGRNCGGGQRVIAGLESVEKNQKSGARLFRRAGHIGHS